MANSALNSPGVGALTAFILPVASNLRATFGIASSAQTVVTADSIVVRDASNNPMLLASYSKTADITVSGAGGLDTGAEASGTWYFVWAIAKPDSTNSILLSVSATAPSLPSGYTYKALIGAVRNNGSSNIEPGWQRGNWCYARDRVNIITNGAATSETEISIAAAAPTIAQDYVLSIPYVGGIADGTGLYSSSVSLFFVAGSAARSMAYAMTGAASANSYFGATDMLVPYTGYLAYAHAPVAYTALYVTADINAFRLPIAAS